jgi:AraC family transcriptional regulator, alkane utilization regulator
MTASPGDMTETPNPDRKVGMDALSDVLRVAHLTGGVFLHAEFFEPWCMSARLAPEHCAPALGPASHLIVYHYVVEGDLHVRVGEDGEDLVIGSGEVVLLPRNGLHLMGSDLSLPAVAGSDIIHPPKNGGLASIHHGGDGRRTQMICGFLGCASGEGNPVLSNLPPLLKLNVEQGGAAEWIRSTFQYAAEEVANGRPGSETVLAKLSELLFVEAVRRYAEALPDGQTGWFAGLREPHVARALALLHGDITRHWTVEDLSREVGLSRSALADRFIGLIGVPTMHYLATWRMQVATQRLRITNASLAQVAEFVGYDSEAAFSRAFKKSFGAAPATWRRSNS